MSNELYTRDALLSVEEFERIDKICLEFERAWKSGQTPEIELLLGESEGEERRSLLSHLVQLEIYYRRQRGSDPSSAEYCSLLPPTRQVLFPVLVLIQVGLKQVSPSGPGLER